jgi:hypothetical protein
MTRLKKSVFTNLVILGWIAACSPVPVQPMTTTDQILAAQYHAQTLHGALSGKEAQSVVDQYQQHIGAKLAETSDTMDTKQ